MKAPREVCSSRGAFIIVTRVARADYGPLTTRHLSQTLLAPV